MSEPVTCPQCGAALPAGSPDGLCPACLLKRGLEGATVGFTEARTSRLEPPSAEDLAARFPELEITRLIGRGGMGAVYQARQKNLDRVIALKILPPEMAGDAAFAERFAREAQAMARLNHPHVVTIYEFGEKAGLYYFIMEYLDGASLRTLLDSGHVTPREALAIVPQICEALQYAHDQGIVHRDIKPENILLNKQGQVKIADFGLAKLMGRDGTGHWSMTAGQHGETAAAGTPAYMAPEQLERPAEVDQRADIYSLGVVFYQMLTGELPAGKFEVPSKKVQIDVRLDQVVLKALERQPEKRYQHASEVKTEVETVAQAQSRAAVPTAAVPPLRDEPSRAGDATVARARSDLQVPSVGLRIGATINLLLILLPLLVIACYRVVAHIPPVAQPSSNKPVMVLLPLLVLLVPYLLCNIMVLRGAAAMARVEHYRSAVAAALLAMLLPPGFIVGLPMGIWALVVLNLSHVKAAFASVARREPRVPSPSRTLWRRAGLSLAVLIVASLAIAMVHDLILNRISPLASPTPPAPEAPAGMNPALAPDAALIGRWESVKIEGDPTLQHVAVSFSADHKAVSISEQSSGPPTETFCEWEIVQGNYLRITNSKDPNDEPELDRIEWHNDELVLHDADNTTVTFRRIDSPGPAVPTNGADETGPFRNAYIPRRQWVKAEAALANLRFERAELEAAAHEGRPVKTALTDTQAQIADLEAADAKFADQWGKMDALLERMKAAGTTNDPEFEKTLCDTNTAEAQLRMAEALVEVEFGPARFGPEIEVHVPYNNVAPWPWFDVDNNHVETLPQDDGPRGADFVAMGPAERPALSPGAETGFGTVPLDAREWTTLTPFQLAQKLRTATVTDVGGDGVLPSTWGFTTRSGGVGLLQILDADEKGVHIRYKKVRFTLPETRPALTAPASTQTTSTPAVVGVPYYVANIPQGQPIVELIAGARENDMRRLLHACTVTIRAEFADEPEQEKKFEEEIRPTILKQFGDIAPRDMEFAFDGDDQRGTVTVTYQGKVLARNEVVKEAGEWKLTKH